MLDRLPRAFIVLMLVVWRVAPAEAGSLKCPRDSVAVGPLCVDKYENSVWRIPAGAKGVIARLRAGKVTLADLQAVGAQQLCSIPLGENTCNTCTFGPTFPDNGNWTEPAYAASLPAVMPTTCLTWFQAEQACRLAGKRLITNEEWQAAAAGTPDPGDADDGSTTCDTNTEQPVAAGTRSACVSSWGAYDMVGNVWEWVAGWSDLATGCIVWDGTFGDDMSCVGPNYTPPPGFIGPPAPLTIPGDPKTDIFPVDPRIPGAVIRGGNFAAGTRNGVFAIYGAVPPHNRSRSTGFRCAR